MPTRSSDVAKMDDSDHPDLTTKREITHPEPAATPETPAETVTPEANKAEGAAAELVAAHLDERELVPATEAEANTDAEGEATAQTVEAAAFEEFLSDERERIDAIDDQILELVARRLEIAEALLTRKHQRGIDPRDKLRQNEIYGRH